MVLLQYINQSIFKQNINLRFKKLRPGTSGFSSKPPLLFFCPQPYAPFLKSWFLCFSSCVISAHISAARELKLALFFLVLAVDAGASRPAPELHEAVGTQTANRLPWAWLTARSLPAPRLCLNPGRPPLQLCIRPLQITRPCPAMFQASETRANESKGAFLLSLVKKWVNLFYLFIFATEFSLEANTLKKVHYSVISQPVIERINIITVDRPNNPFDFLLSVTKSRIPRFHIEN